MFVAHEVLLDVSFAVARARFAESVRDGWLTDASGRAHADGLSGLIRVGPFGAVLGASKLVRVQILEPVPRDDTVALPVRWEAVGAIGRLFPVFDADLVLSATDAGKTLVALRGSTAHRWRGSAPGWTGSCCTGWPRRPFARCCKVSRKSSPSRTRIR